jgi:predicted anti-sigma-YlaC factor YlaD
LGMTCKGVLGSLSDYLEGDVGKKVCAEIEEHLDGCERCRMHVDSMRKVITLYKRWRDDTIPKDVSIRLKNVIANEAARSAPKRPRRRKPRSGRRRGE